MASAAIQMSLVGIMQAGNATVYAGSWRHPATEHGILTASYYQKLGRTLDGAVKSYNETVGSLERQVLPQARRFEQAAQAWLAAGDRLRAAEVREHDLGDLAGAAELYFQARAFAQAGIQKDLFRAP